MTGIAVKTEANNNAHMAKDGRKSTNTNMKERCVRHYEKSTKRIGKSESESE